MTMTDGIHIIITEDPGIWLALDTESVLSISNTSADRHAEYAAWARPGHGMDQEWAGASPVMDCLT